jgi:phosphate starvation-inducible PhoH-like protein
MARKQRKAKAHKRQTHAEYVESNVHYLPQAQKQKQVHIHGRNPNQKEYIEKLLDPQQTIIFATGPAGTGKTMLAVLAAVKALKDQTIDRIIVTRPAVGVDDERHGFLPGSLEEKMEPWTKPIFDVVREYYNAKQIQTMIAEGVIEISPLAFMRGRTFKNAFVIADEMQNATPGQMKMLLTRIGDDSRMAITGDIAQTDRKEHENGLMDFQKLYARYSSSKYISLCVFDNFDIERHPAVAEVLNIYGDK